MDRIGIDVKKIGLSNILLDKVIKKKTLEGEIGKFRIVVTEEPNVVFITKMVLSKDKDGFGFPIKKFKNKYLCMDTLLIKAETLSEINNLIQAVL